MMAAVGSKDSTFSSFTKSLQLPNLKNQGEVF
jgi:hypothetical protein